MQRDERGRSTGTERQGPFESAGGTGNREKRPIQIAKRLLESVARHGELSTLIWSNERREPYDGGPNRPEFGSNAFR